MNVQMNKMYKVSTVKKQKTHTKKHLTNCNWELI